MLPDWTPKVLGAAVFIHVSQFLVLSAASVPVTSTNPFTTLKNLVFFSALPIPTWATFALFVLVSLPILLIVAGYIFQMFGSEIGAAVAILLGFATAAIGFLA